MKTLGFTLLGALCFGLAGLTATDAVMHVAYAPHELVQSLPGAEYALDWGRIVPLLLGIASALIGAFAGPKMRALFDDITGKYVPDRLRPDKETQEAIARILEIILASDVPDPAKVSLLREMLKR